MKSLFILIITIVLLLLSTNTPANETAVNCLPLLDKYIVKDIDKPTNQEITLREKIIQCITRERQQLLKIAKQKKRVKSTKGKRK